VLTPITNKKTTIESSQTMVEISTQTLMPTAKYHFLKCFDWVNSLIYKEFTEKMPEGDRLMIFGQERLNELLVEADKMNELDDYLDDP
jgi:D-mannonate dehydratase